MPDGAALLQELPLFAAATPAAGVLAAGEGQAVPSALDEALAAIDPDELTPKDALEALYRLKELCGKRDA
jgi:DNA mismatch repair protein MutS